MDTTENIQERDKRRIEGLIKLLQDIAGGEFKPRYIPGEMDDEIEALGTGVNLLAEEIEAKVTELERFNKLFTGRELAMAELKKKNKMLEEALKKAGGAVAPESMEASATPSRPF